MRIHRWGCSRTGTGLRPRRFARMAEAPRAGWWRRGSATRSGEKSGARQSKAYVVAIEQIEGQQAVAHWPDFRPERPRQCSLFGAVGNGKLAGCVLRNEALSQDW